MPEYRLYRLTPDGHVSGPADIITCADDGEAIAQAHARLAGKDLEVWQDDRRVALIKHRDPRP